MRNRFKCKKNIPHTLFVLKCREESKGKIVANFGHSRHFATFNTNKVSLYADIKWFVHRPWNQRYHGLPPPHQIISVGHVTTENQKLWRLTSFPDPISITILNQLVEAVPTVYNMTLSPPDVIWTKMTTSRKI